VIDVDAAVRKSTPAEIPVYWEGNWNPSASEEDWDAFFDVSDRLIRDNLFTVLGGRVATFSMASGFGDEMVFRGPEQLSEREAERFTWIAQKEGLEGEAPVLRLYDLESDVLRPTGEYDGLTPSGSALHWNLVPSLVLLEAAFALIVLSRVPLVFAAAPAAQFKYYYSVHLGGIILLGLLLAHVRSEHVRGLAGALRVRRPVTS
jgi:hypothetical protein